LTSTGAQRTLSVTDSCRDGTVMTLYDVSNRDTLINLAHF
jgi:hypothetical protein